jgi:hypothetical protein
MDFSGLTEQRLRQLIDAGEPPCVSIYVPLGKNGVERGQARIRLKNQLGRAERALFDRGAKAGEIEVLLKPMRALLEPDAPMAGGPSALALLRSSRTFESLELPEPTPEVTSVGDSFNVTPLLSLVNVNQRYRVLALSQNDVRFFEGDRYTFRSLDVPQLPRNLKEALYDDDDSNETLQFHTGAAPSGGDRPAVFHGQAIGKEHSKERILRFCQLVDNVANDYFDDQEVPLILVAAEPLPGVYRQANSYRNLHTEVVPGDPRRLSKSVMHERTWQLIAPQATQERAEALGRFEESLGKGRGTADLSSALDAAREGRVAALFVNTDRTQTGPRGRLRNNTDAASPSDEDYENRVNRAVAETLRHGGRAFAVPNDPMPQGASIGALYRY